MRDRMTDEQLARAKGQSSTTNHLNSLAQTANGFGVSRADRREAEAALIKARGNRGAKKLMKQAANRVVKDTF